MKTRRIRRRAFATAAVLSLSTLLASQGLVSAGGDIAPRHRSGPPDAALAARLSHLTLDDAIDISLHRNPDILRQLQEIQRLQGVFIEVRSNALPHVIATGTFNETDRSLVEGTGSSSTGTGTPTGTGTAPGATGTSLNIPLVDNTGTVQSLLPLKSLFGSETENTRSYQIQVEVQQTLYNAAIPPAIRQARFLRDAAYYQLRETVDTVINTVKADFYTVLVDKALIDIQNENLRLLQSQLTDQQNRFAAGTVPRFDVLQASVAVANQRPLVITAVNNYNLAYISFARTLGIEYGPEQERNSPIKLVGNLDYHPQNFDPVAGVNAGKANRALLKGQRLNILAEVEQIRIAAAGYQPTLIAEGGFESRNDALSDDLGRTLNGWFYGATFNWNIFDGLATYGRAKQARATLKEARITYLDDVNAVVQDIQNNYLTLNQNKELIASQVLNVSEAEEAVRLAQARLSAGAGTQLDVLQSQTSLLQAQTTELQARFNYAVSLANYERVTGTSTVYDEAFNDPLTSRRYPNGVDNSGTAPTGAALPMGSVKTPDVSKRGSGKPVPNKTDASTDSGKPYVPLRQREHLFENQ